jgi:multidrug resistance efflux pump
MRGLPILACGGALAAVAFLWQEQAGPSTSPGEVEAVFSEVISPGAGLVGLLHVDRFGQVEAGDPLVHLITTPPEVVHASLAVLKAEIELTRLGWFDPLLDQQRNALQLESAKLDWLEKRAAIAIRGIELQQAEREFIRVEKLFGTRMISEDEFDRARSRFEVLAETIRQESDLAEQMEVSLAGLRLRPGETDFAPAAMTAALTLQKERLHLLETQLRPITLFAPISGMVTSIDRFRGEHVVEGGRILTIRPDRAERIVAYLRQPLVVEPEVGMRVEVTTRGRPRQKAVAEIAAIGPQIEPLGPVFARPMSPYYESGLPVVLNIPPELRLRPGELVDVSLRP